MALLSAFGAALSAAIITLLLEPGPYLQRSRSSVSFLQRKYFFSDVNFLNWYDAQVYCKTWFGSDSKLLEIETPEKLGLVQKVMSKAKDEELGAFYWVGGKMDVLKETLVWESTGRSLEQPWITWAPVPHQPIKNIDARTIIWFLNQNTTQWMTANATATFRFICEYDQEEFSTELAQVQTLPTPPTVTLRPAIESTLPRPPSYKIFR